MGSVLFNLFTSQSNMAVFIVNYGSSVANVS